MLRRVGPTQPCFGSRAKLGAGTPIGNGYGDEMNEDAPYSGCEVAQIVGIMPDRLAPERRAEVERQLGGHPEKVAYDWWCHCGRSLVVFDARDRSVAMACAEAFGWRFDERNRLGQCADCVERGVKLRYGGRGSDGSNFGPLHLQWVGRKKPVWICIGTPDKEAVLARVADCIGAICRHLTTHCDALDQCAASAAVARRLLRGDLEWWSK